MDAVIAPLMRRRLQVTIMVCHNANVYALAACPISTRARTCVHVSTPSAYPMERHILDDPSNYPQSEQLLTAGMCDHSVFLL